MSNTADHKPSERHTVDEVLKSLQDLIRNEALDDGKPKAPPAPAEPAEPRKRGRPRKVVIPDAAAPANPRRRSSASLSDELNNVLASLNDLVNTDLDGSSVPKKPAAPPAATGKPISSETAPAPDLISGRTSEVSRASVTARGPRLDPSDDLQAAAEALAAMEETPADSADIVTPSFEDMAESAEEIDAAPPPAEPVAAETKPVPVETPAPPAAPKKQLELKVLEPGEWKEPGPISSPPPKPTARASAAAAKPPESKKPAAKAEPSPAKSRPSPPPAPSARAPEPAAPAPVAKPVTPVTSPDDVDMIDLDQTDAVTDLVVSGNTDAVEATPRKPSSAKPAQTQRTDDAPELELELTLEDPTRRSSPATPVIDQAREKELHSLGLAEIDFSQVPEASSEQFAAFASSDDNIPLLEDEVMLPSPAPGLDPRQIRELSVRAIARLNIEMRKAGEQGLDVKTIQRLQALLREELEKAGNPGENTRPKK